MLARAKAKTRATPRQESAAVPHTAAPPVAVAARARRSALFLSDPGHTEREEEEDTSSCVACVHEVLRSMFFSLRCPVSAQLQIPRSSMSKGESLYRYWTGGQACAAAQVPKPMDAQSACAAAAAAAQSRVGSAWNAVRVRSAVETPFPSLPSFWDCAHLLHAAGWLVGGSQRLRLC